ncbi:hypothetical protein K2X33_02485, partial [bacterium]|nr:hypothetical protein [bacterium]
MRFRNLSILLSFALFTALLTRDGYAEYGLPMRPVGFNGHVTYRTAATQPGNSTSYLVVGRAFGGSNYKGLITSVLVDGGLKNGSFTKNSAAWYPGTQLIDFAGAGLDNLCNAAVYAYDGYIVACRSMKANGYYDIYLAKFSSSGSLITAFGTNGIMATGVGGNSTKGQAFVRGIVYNDDVNSSHHGVVTIVGSVGTNGSNYRPYIASYDQQTGAAWGSTLKLTDYVGTAVNLVYDTTTSNAYYMPGVENSSPKGFHVHKFIYSGGDSDTSLDEAGSPWGDSIDFTVAGGGTESVPTGIALGNTGAWGVDIVVSGSNKINSSTGPWRCSLVALESSTGNPRSGYGYVGIAGGTDDEGFTIVSHEGSTPSHDCIFNNVISLSSGETAAVGTSYTGGSANYDQLTVRIASDGVPVSGFGSSGYKLISAGPADDVTNGAVLVGSNVYAVGRVHDASLYQGGDVQQFAVSNGAIAPYITGLTVTPSGSVLGGAAPSLTVTATLSDSSTMSIPLSSLNWSTTDTGKFDPSSFTAVASGSGQASVTASIGDGVTADFDLDVIADEDQDGIGADSDCDDQDPTSFPGATEICNDTHDNDCDGLVDFSDVSDCGSDTDGDGVGDSVDDCYDIAVYGHGYKVCGLLNGPKDYATALTECASYPGYRLASLGSKDEADTVMNAYAPLGLGFGHFYMNGTDIAQEDHWVTSDGFQLTYTPWQSGGVAGSGGGGTSQNCLCGHESYGPMTFDIECNTPLTFMCEAALDGDQDSDGVLDVTDNCPTDSPNADQTDLDHDGTGEYCEASPFNEYSPAAFKRFGKSLYLYYNAVSRDFGAARTQCRNEGGHLVTIADQEENDAIFMMSPADWTYIGLTDAGSEGTFAWVTGEADAYRNWGGGQPDNGIGSGPDQEGAVLSTGGNVWDDMWTDQSLTYICEYGDGKTDDGTIGASNDGVSTCQGEDYCCTDSDSDGSCDGSDLCTGNDTSGDTDSDGICNDTDGCPMVASAGTDGDSDGIDDACDDNDSTPPDIHGTNWTNNYTGTNWVVTQTGRIGDITSTPHSMTIYFYITSS